MVKEIKKMLHSDKIRRACPIAGTVAWWIFLIWAINFQVCRGMGMWFHHSETELIVYGSLSVMLLATGLLPDFFRIFLYQWKEMDEVSEAQLKRSLLAVKLGMATAGASQLLSMILGFVDMLGHFDTLSASMSSWLALYNGLILYGGSAVHGILAIMILLPLYAWLKSRLIADKKQER